MPRALDDCDGFNTLKKSPLPAHNFSSEHFLKSQIKHPLLTFFYGTTPTNSVFIEQLQSLADEQGVYDSYKALLSGKKINISEDRAITHHHNRDLKSMHVQETLHQLNMFKKELDQNQTFDTIVQVGIGGSQLGPEAIYNAFQSRYDSNYQVKFLSNIDPVHSHTLLSQLNLHKTLFIVVSKSGSTQETLANLSVIKTALSQVDISKDAQKKQLVAITIKGSDLDDAQQFSKCFYFEESVGGRFSSTSAVGLTLLTLVFGVEKVSDFLQGATEMDQQAEQQNILENASLFAALIGLYNRNIRGLQSKAIIPYQEALSLFIKHLQQLDCESNGKTVNRHQIPITYETAPVIFGDTGSNSQHAFFQMLHQGSSIIPIEFIGVKHCHIASENHAQLNNHMLAQMIALSRGQKNDNPNKNFAGGRPSTLVLLEELSAKTIGALLAFYENLIMFQGFLWNLNSFDQEGVELGKNLSKKLNQPGEDPELDGLKEALFS